MTASSQQQTNKATVVTSSDGDIPAQKYRPVLKKFSGANNWPQQSVILPGNEVLFSLETASDYVKDDKVRIYKIPAKLCFVFIWLFGHKLNAV